MEKVPMNEKLSRREWILAWSVGLTAAWHEVVAAQAHARHAARSGGTVPLSYFSPEAAAEVEAIAERIIPTTDTPGARDAGVIYFIDRALNTFDKDKQPIYRTGIAELQRKRLKMFPGSKSIAALDPEQQLMLVKTIEETKFFELVRLHSILGFFGSTNRDGDRQPLGWALLGIEGKAVFQAPFGYYDAQAREDADR
jgi:gluconate 2-dehydrogenase gamma chain